jgi:hypothetical protein
VIDAAHPIRLADPSGEALFFIERFTPYVGCVASLAAIEPAGATGGLNGGARWIRTAGPGCSIGSGQFLPVSVLCQRRSARLKRTGERLASDSDQSDVYVCPRKGAGRHDGFYPPDKFER